MDFAQHQSRLRGGTLLVVLALMLSPSSARAQLPPRPPAVPELKNLSLEELANVEVTSPTKQPERVIDTAASIFVITGDDIRRSGAITIPDALRLAPGMIVNQSDSNRWAVGIRGFADVFSKNVLVLIDGRSVYTPLVGGVHWAIQDVLLADIDRIEVIRGAGGTVWGANSVNGVINIITKAAGDTRGFRATAATGTVEHGRVSLRFGGNRGDALDYRTYVKAFTRDAQYHADGANFDKWKALQGGFRTDWRPTTRDAVTISGDMYSSRAGERAAVSRYSPPVTETIDHELDLTGGNLLARWDRTFSNGARTHLQSYYDRTTRKGATFSEVRDTFDVDFNTRLTRMKRHELSFGIGARISPSTVTQLVPTLNFVPNDKTNTLVSGFVHDEVAIVPRRFSVSAGVKLEHNDYTGTEVLPSARVLWTPTPAQTLWAAATRSVRTPSRFERDLRFQVLLDPAAPFYAAINGSDEFMSETVRGLEAGYRQLLASNLYVDVVAFQNEYDGLAGFGAPAVSAEVNPVPHLRVSFPFANSVEGRTRGFEIAPDWKPRPFWVLKGSYSYLHVALDTKPGYTDTSQRDNYVGMAPTHHVRVQSRVDLPRRFELDQTYRYVSAHRAPKVPAYHALDTRLGWQPSDQVELSIVGYNLLDPHHPEFTAVPVEIRRSVYVQLSFKR